MKRIGIGVKGLITMGDKFLVLVKPNGELDLPGGRVEESERYVNALYREIIEETGLKVKVQAIISDWSFIKNKWLLITGATYLCQYLSGRVALSNEHSAYFWHPFCSVTQPNLSRWFSHKRGTTKRARSDVVCISSDKFIYT